MAYRRDFLIFLLMEFLMGHIMDIIMDNIMNHSMDRVVHLMGMGINNPCTHLIMDL